MWVAGGRGHPTLTVTFPVDCFTVTTACKLLLLKSTAEPIQAANMQVSEHAAATHLPPLPSRLAGKITV